MTTMKPFNLTLHLRHSPNVTRRLIACAIASTSLLGSAYAQPRYAVTDLGVLPGCDTSVAVGVNDRGDIAGYCQNGGNQVAVIWRNGQLVNLGKLAGGTYAMAASINSQGVAVGDGDTGDGRPRIWVSTTNGLY